MAEQKHNPAWSKWLLWFCLLAAVESMAAIGLVFSAPSEGSSAIFLGLSASRWMLGAGLAALGAIFGQLYALGAMKHKSWSRVEKAVGALTQSPIWYAVILGLGVVVLIVGFYLILLSFKFTDTFVQSRLMRLLPLTAWATLFGLQIMIIWPQLRFSRQVTVGWKGRLRAWIPAAVALAGIVGVSVFIGLTGLGLQPDRTGWDSPGTPVMGTQVLWAVMGAIVLYGLMMGLRKLFGWRLSKLDVLVMAVLWLVAVFAWQSQPLAPTYFSPAPRAPNYSYYPYSDAAKHDIAAQSLLVGEGFIDVVEKPLYSFFLTIVHALVGQDYANVVLVQIGLLALFPAVLYALGSRMHHRISGLLLALVVILREANSIALSGKILVSHAKLLMTDLPTALGLAGLTLLVLRWLQDHPRSLRWAMGIGGALGVLLLLRSQVLIFLPFLLVLAFWRVGGNWRSRLTASALMLLGFVLVAVPWMWRNYKVLGEFGYSQPIQMLYMAKQYSLTPEANDPGFPPDTIPSEYVSLGSARVREFVMQHPGEVVRFITAHFLHNEVSSVLALPIRFDLADKLVTFYNLRLYWEGLEGRLWNECCSLESILTTNPYWDRWDGNFPPDAWLPLAVNLVIVSIGIGAAWRRVGWLTLVPIGMHLLYSVSSAVARVSGWRLILPADWVLILFYCAGLAQVGLWAWCYFFSMNSEEEPKAKDVTETAAGWGSLLVTGALLLLAGVVIPITEQLVPSRYANKTSEQAQAAWDDSDLSATMDVDIAEFLDQTGSRVIWGRTLYPMFYPADQGEPGDEGGAYDILPFARMAFRVISSGSYEMVLPMAEAPAAFPNGVDVLVLGCRGDKYFEAGAVIFPNGEALDLLAEETNPLTCSYTVP